MFKCKHIKYIDRWKKIKAFEDKRFKKSVQTMGGYEFTHKKMINVNICPNCGEVFLDIGWELQKETKK